MCFTVVQVLTSFERRHWLPWKLGVISKVTRLIYLHNCKWRKVLFVKWWKFMKNSGGRWFNELGKAWELLIFIKQSSCVSENPIVPFQLHVILRCVGSFSCYPECKQLWQCRRRWSWNEKIFRSNRYEKKESLCSITNNAARNFAGNDCWLKQEEMERQQPESHNSIRRKIEILRGLLKTFTRARRARLHQWCKQPALSSANPFAKILHNCRNINNQIRPHFDAIHWKFNFHLWHLSDNEGTLEAARSGKVANNLLEKIELRKWHYWLELETVRREGGSDADNLSLIRSSFTCGKLTSLLIEQTLTIQKFIVQMCKLFVIIKCLQKTR